MNKLEECLKTHAPKVKLPEVLEVGKDGLQSRIKSLLKRRGIKYYGYSQTQKRTSYTRGWPDLVIPISGGVTLYWEIKTSKGKLSPEQDSCLRYLAANGHKARIITSYAEAEYILDHEYRR
jgi:hypothetical protein